MRLDQRCVDHPNSGDSLLNSFLCSWDELGGWPELERIVREKVKPEREALGSNPNNSVLKRKWWCFQAHRPELYAGWLGREHNQAD